MSNEYIPPPHVMKPIKAVIAPARSFIPDMTDDDLRKLAREKLSEALQSVDPVTQPAMTQKLCSELMDRLDGKPAQAMTLDATMRTITVNATISFAEPHMVIEGNTTSITDVEAIENKR